MVIGKIIFRGEKILPEEEGTGYFGAVNV